jgi:putative sigma-54 modulation protein
VEDKMDIKVVVRNCEIKQAENDYILEKVENLSRFGLNPKNIVVTVKKEGFNYDVELFLNALSKNFVIEKKGEKVTEVIDIIVEKMAVNLIKHKDKVKDHKKQKINVDINEDLVNDVKVVYKNVDSLESLSNTQAIDKLVNSKNSFLVFRDLYTDVLSIAIKKEDVIEIIEG